MVWSIFHNGIQDHYQRLTKPVPCSKAPSPAKRRVVQAHRLRFVGAGSSCGPISCLRANPLHLRLVFASSRRTLGPRPSLPRCPRRWPDLPPRQQFGRGHGLAVAAASSTAASAAREPPLDDDMKVASNGNSTSRVSLFLFFVLFFFFATKDDESFVFFLDISGTNKQQAPLPIVLKLCHLHFLPSSNYCML